MLRRRKEQVLVYFIGNNRHIVFATQFRDQGQFLLREYPPGGILRRVQDQRTRFPGKSRPEFVCIECPGRRM